MVRGGREMNNEEKKDRIIRRIEEQTKDMQDWPDWKKNINLTDASTFTISTSSNYTNRKVSESDE